MPPTTPGEIELYSHFSQHFGPRYEAAGLRVQFQKVSKNNLNTICSVLEFERGW